MKKLLKGLVITFTVLGILISPFAWMVYKFKEATKTRTDPDQFEAILSRRNKDGFKPHFFPNKIEENAERVGFYYIPGFLQGGTTMALRMKFPEGQSIPLFSDVSTEKVLRVSDFNKAGFTHEVRSLPPFHQKWKYNWEELQPISKNFVIYLQSDDLAKVQEHWNHNEISFVAVSHRDREILYYYSQW